MKAFTDRSVKSLVPKERSYEIHGGGGLPIKVSPNGRKSWVFGYQ